MTIECLAVAFWVASGLMAFALRWRRPHGSWFISWRSKMGLALLMVTLLFMHAFLGPISFGIRIDRNA
jgi:hypothetical protein